MKIFTIILFFIMNSLSAEYNCIDDFYASNSSKNDQLALFEDCFVSNINAWYEYNDDFTLFDLLDKYFNKYDGYNLEKLAANKKFIDVRIRSAIALFAPDKINDRWLLNGDNINFVQLIKYLQSDNKNDIHEKEIIKILNESDLKFILFFLNYVAFKKLSIYKYTIYNINTKRFPDIGMHSDREILEGEQDATLGSFLNE
jgi:hypothetical protein